MIGLKILGTATKGAETNNLYVLLKYGLAIFVIPGIIEFTIRFCQKRIASKFNVSKDLKIYNYIIRMSIILLAVPVIIFGVLPMLEIKLSLFDHSDVLAYFGAVIGGIGTILGVYLTLSYESEKSKEEIKQERENLKEERRKDSLPVLRFDFKPAGFSSQIVKPNNRVQVSDTKGIWFKNYDIVIDTTDGSEVYSESSIHVFGKLKIKNIGLGLAIISDIKLVRTTPEAIEVKNTGTLESNKHLLWTEDNASASGTDDNASQSKPAIKASQSFSMSIRSDDLNKDDTLQFTFMDLYRNEYFYKIPFINIEESTYLLKTKITEDDVEVIPQFSTH